MAHLTNTISSPKQDGSAVRAPADRWLALAAPAGALIMALGWITLGLLRPAERTEWGVAGGIRGALTSPISGLGVPPNGVPLGVAQYTAFDVVFVLTGVLLAAGVVGIFRVLGSTGAPQGGRMPAVLLTLTGLGAVLCGIFTLDALALHMLGFGLAAAVPVVSLPLTGRYLRRIPGRQRLGGWLMAAGPLTLIFLVAYLASFNLDTVAAAHGVAGLTSRLLVTEVTAWFAVLGWHAFRQTHR